MSEHVGTSAGIERRWRILQAIEQLHGESGDWPSPVQVAQRLAIAARTLRYHLPLLTADGWIDRLHGGRALKLLRPVPASPTDMEVAA